MKKKVTITNKFEWLQTNLSVHRSGTQSNILLWSVLLLRCSEEFRTELKLRRYLQIIIIIIIYWDSIGSCIMSVRAKANHVLSVNVGCKYATLKTWTIKQVTFSWYQYKLYFLVKEKLMKCIISELFIVILFN